MITMSKKLRLPATATPMMTPRDGPEEAESPRAPAGPSVVLRTDVSVRVAVTDCDTVTGVSASPLDDSEIEDNDEVPMEDLEGVLEVELASGGDKDELRAVGATAVVLLVDCPDPPPGSEDEGVLGGCELGVVGDGSVLCVLCADVVLEVEGAAGVVTTVVVEDL